MVTVSDEGSFVWIVQVPFPLLTPALKLQSDGTPFTVSVVNAPLSDRSANPRSIGIVYVNGSHAIVTSIRHCSLRSQSRFAEILGR